MVQARAKFLLSVLSVLFASLRIGVSKFEDFSCVPGDTVTDGVQYIAPNLSFSQDGVIRQWKIGVEDRRDESVYLQLWRLNGGSFTRVGETLYVKSTAGEIVEVPTSMSASAGDVVGFYNPRPGGDGLKLNWVSVTNHVMYGGERSGDREAPLSTIEIMDTFVSSPLLSISFEPNIAPTDVVSASNNEECTCCLSTFEDFKYACGVKMDDDRQYIASDLKFECDGVIREWKVGLEPGGNGQTVHLQAWHPSNTHYSLISEVTYTKTNGEMIAQIPASMTVSAGDVVGLYVPNKKLEPLWISKHGFNLYTIQGNAQTSVVVANSIASSPLITVVFEPSISSLVASQNVPILQSTSHSMLLSTTLGIGEARSDATLLSSTLRTDKLTPTVDKSQSTSLVIDSSTPITDEDNLIVITAVIVAVLVVVVILIVAIVVMTTLVLLRGKKRDQSSFDAAYHRGEYSGDGVVSLRYRETGGDSAQEIVLNNSAVDDVHTYEYPTMIKGAPDGYEVTVFHSTTKGYEQPVISTNPLAIESHYELPSTSLDDSECLYGYVPSQIRRLQSSTSQKNKKVYEDILSLVSGYDSVSELEHVPFTEPRTKVEDLYDQLSEVKCIEIPPQVLRKDDILGAGEFGEVYRGVWDSPYGPQDVAIKLLRTNSDSSEKTKFLQEAAIMGQFRHTNIVRFIGAVTLREPTMLVLEYLHEGDLEDYLHAQSMKIATKKIDGKLPSLLLSFCRDIAGGMKYLSNKGFIHRDLAARNILLDKNLKCKIADFGLSRDLSDDTYYIAKGGKIPIRWTAPEAILYKKFSTRSDVWSYGMLMYEIWSLGVAPFSTLTAKEVIRSHQAGKINPQAPPPGCPKAIYRIMVHCWNPDHHLRPTFLDILQTLTDSDRKLLDVPKENVKIPSEAFKLGAPIASAASLYEDLQQMYIC